MGKDFETLKNKLNSFIKFENILKKDILYELNEIKENFIKIFNFFIIMKKYILIIFNNESYNLKFYLLIIENLFVVIYEMILKNNKKKNTK